MRTPRLRLYALALHLYPATFRARYADEMLDTARHEYARATNPRRFTISLAADTLRGALREHLRAASPTRPGYVAAFALFFTCLLLTVSVVHQQFLRRSADGLPGFIAGLVSSPPMDEQSESARQRIVADDLNSPKQEISTPHWLNTDNQIFTVLYDPSGRPLTGNATLHGALPQPPHGIFDVIRTRGEDKVTWQPNPGIRVALTGRPLPNGGFVLAGQSLIPSEARTARLDRILRWMWLFAMLACLALVLFTPTRKPTP